MPHSESTAEICGFTTFATVFPLYVTKISSLYNQIQIFSKISSKFRRCYYHNYFLFFPTFAANPKDRHTINLVDHGLSTDKRHSPFIRHANIFSRCCLLHQRPIHIYNHNCPGGYQTCQTLKNEKPDKTFVIFSGKTPII